MASFKPADIPDLSGKIILITGGNKGLGKETTLQLAKHNPERIFIGSRDINRGSTTIAEIVSLVPNAKLTIIELDLALLSSVQAAAKQFLAISTRLDILINNAGIMAVPPELTADGYEIQFAINHLGHAFLTKLLLPTMLKTAQSPGSDVRIITLTSNSHNKAPKEGIEFSTLHSAISTDSELLRYGQSKLANILHSKELARRYPNITSVAIHPGTVDTELTATMQKNHILIRIIAPILGRIIGVKVQEGALNQLWAATSTGVENGAYYEPVGKKRVGSELSRNMTLAEKLWEWTENEFLKLDL